MSDCEKPVASPCVSICALNEDDICIGCFRTGREISEWGALDNRQRREILTLVAAREKKSNPLL